MIQLQGSAPVFVVRDVVKSVAYYRDALGFHAAHAWKRQPGRRPSMYSSPTWMRSTRSSRTGAPGFFNVADLEGNDLCFGMESKR